MIRQYLVDAFTDQLFCGNPAAVCVLDEWPDDRLMKQIAAENNLSETAFTVKEGDLYRLRWFTPTVEINLCGHATLATGFVLLNHYETEAQSVEFITMSGKLKVTRIDDTYELDFPTYDLHEIEVTDAMEQAFGARPAKAVLGMDLICVYDDEETVRNMKPDISLVEQLPGRLQNVTAPGKDADCVTRSFCPKAGIIEDPVCGSAHCQVADYWAGVLDRTSVTAYQASARGGTLYCELAGDRIRIRGKAVLFAVCELNI
ncbi:MAG: PhzF family phenazine biosynthesis protein [Erysipelotrichaceae bacterium]|nr:PhzF family phenazine biosynthesis protein [Erysipelotrichaceae bacterium]